MLCVRRIVKRIRPDIIHANNFHAMAVTSLSCGLGESRLVWHARDLPRQGILTRWCIRRAKRIIAVSKAVKHRLVELGARNENVDVVYNGVDPITTDVPDMKTGSENITFSCVGQIVRWKNQDAFLDAADIVHKQYPKARFLLVGSNVFGRRDSYEAQLRRRIESQSSYVQHIGWQKDMNPIWRMTDCLVHTARMEPFGRVLIEAMAHGSPVVAFASGGPAEIVEDGQTGFLVPFGDVQGLSEAMLRLASNGDLATSMGQDARQRVEEHFSADKTAEGVMDVYRNVLEEC
jgi:glycosyltransferase involved in cell wall biosynthesis